MTEPTSDVFFFFGQEPGAFLISTKTASSGFWIYRRLPPKLTSVIKNGEGYFFYYFAITENDEAAYAFTTNGQDYRWESKHGFSNSRILVDWMGDHHPHGIRNLSYTVGTGGTFAACCVHCGSNISRWVDDECERLTKTRRGVRQVALGVDNAYVVLHENGKDWDLKGKYDRLEDYLSGNNAKVVFVALNPWSQDEWFISFENKQIYFQVHERMWEELKKHVQDAGFNLVGAQP